jgi:hypothetical protein
MNINPRAIAFWIAAFSFGYGLAAVFGGPALAVGMMCLGFAAFLTVIV